jgi:hypothetical protein
MTYAVPRGENPHKSSLVTHLIRNLWEETGRYRRQKERNGTSLYTVSIAAEKSA